MVCFLVLLIMISLVLCFCSLLSSLLSVVASPAVNWKRIGCGPSAKSGRPQIGRATNRFDILRSISMDAQPGQQPAFPNKIIERARPHTSSTPYNYTQPSAPDPEDIQLRQQSSHTAASTAQLQPASFSLTGHAEASCFPTFKRIAHVCFAEMCGCCPC